MSTPARAGRPPSAVIRRERPVSVAWIVPIAAIALAAWLVWQAWAARGTIVTVELARGHGLEVGAAVRHRDIAVGEVRSLALSPGADRVVATLALQRHAARLARGGTRIWVVRPQVGLGGVDGLETVLGARYVQIEPGTGRPQRQFVALEEPPVVEQFEPGDLEVIVNAPTRRGLHRGAPVTHRGVRIGTILSVGLTSDGGAVEARLHVRRPYVGLVTERTRFWPAAGVRGRLSLTGVELEVDSLRSVLGGGLALACPPVPGPPVPTGHRFSIDAEPPSGWPTWAPPLAIGSELLPAGSVRPTPVRAKLSWRKGRIGPLLETTRERSGWLLPIRGPGGLAIVVGPADLLDVPEDAADGSAALEAGGRRIPFEGGHSWVPGRLATVRADLERDAWPIDRLRRPSEPEDVVVVTDPSGDPLPVAADRFTVEHGGWLLSGSIPVDASVHGATVVSRADGLVVGWLLVDEDAGRAEVVLVPERLPTGGDGGSPSGG